MEFKVGDVVRLKSGGPSMTVTKVDTKDVYCCWFNFERETYEYKNQFFPPDTLKHLSQK